jgi:hypothetical protein
MSLPDLSVKQLALLSAGFGVGSLYFWLKSKSTNIPLDLLDVFKLLKFKRQLMQLQHQKWTVADFFEQRADTTPQNLAIDYVNTGVTFTFKQLEEHANKGKFLVQPVFLEKRSI